MSALAAKRKEPISRYRPPLHRSLKPLPPRWEESIARMTRPPFAEFVLLSLLLHVLLVALVGAPSGGSREGRAMWGALNVVIQGVGRDRPAALTPPPAPVITAPLPPPAPPQPAPRAPEVAFPPLLDRVAPEIAVEPLPVLKVPPPGEVALTSQPRIERAPAPEVAAPTAEVRVPAPLRVAPTLAEPRTVELTPTPRVERQAPSISTPLVQPLIHAPDRTAAAAPLVDAPAITRPVAPPVAAAPAIAPVPLVAPAPILAPSPSITAAPPVPIARPLEPALTQEIPLGRPVTALERALTPQPSLDSATKIDRELAPRGTDAIAIPSPFRTGPPVGDFPAGRREPPGGNYDPTAAPTLDPGAVRRRAGQLAREGTGSRGLLPFPMPPVEKPKSQLERDLERARKPDCRDAYKSLGLAAIVPLLANEFGEGSCRW